MTSTNHPTTGPAPVMLRSGRFVDTFNWSVHFDFTTADGTVFLTIERAWSLRDAYERHPLNPTGGPLDWRVGACLAVACDALLSR